MESNDNPSDPTSTANTTTTGSKGQPNVQRRKSAEQQEQYQAMYRLKKPKLEIVQYSNRYYYAFVSLIPSDFAIRVISIGFLQRILFGEELDNFGCVLWYLILLYFLLWRLTYSENYGDL